MHVHSSQLLSSLNFITMESIRIPLLHPSHSLRTNYVAQIPHLNELIDVDLARRVGADLLQGATNLVIALAKAALLTGLDKLALLEVAVTVQIALSARRRGETNGVAGGE